MAITSITIENFKGIGDAVTIPIRPITLLFGKNSAGKSTVLQALRYLREICDGLKIEEKLQKMREENKSEDPRLLEMYELRDMLKAAHFLYLRGSNFDYSKIPKSTQTHGLKNISNISDDDLSEFNSLRDETLKSIQEKFNSTDDWLAPEDDWLNEMPIRYMGNMEKLIQITLLSWAIFIPWCIARNWIEKFEFALNLT